jgi:hypothetical protein
MCKALGRLDGELGSISPVTKTLVLAAPTGFNFATRTTVPEPKLKVIERKKDILYSMIAYSMVFELDRQVYQET